VQRILILGATGVFGQRLSKHLAVYSANHNASHLDIELILTSRSNARAEALVREILSTGAANAKMTAMALDHRAGFKDALILIKPWLVIDCSGPFQGADYSVAKSSLEAGAHIVDLADARDFILGYADALDALAREKGLVALTGASSSPALSFAAVKALTQGWQRIDTIDIAIAPGGRSPVGEAVIAAILSYAGKSVPQWNEGRLQNTLSWVSSIRMELPGLGKRRVSPVETVDAEELSSRYNVTSRIAFYASLESGLEQWGLILLANLRRLGILHNLLWLAPLLLKARTITRLTTGDVGGMLVHVKGINPEGRLVHAEWSLLALNGDGPQVPTMPTAAVVMALLAGRHDPGARVAAGEVQLSAIERETKPYAISTQMCCTQFARLGLFETCIGSEAYEKLSSPVKAFHDAHATPVWEGFAEVGRGRNLISRVIGRIMGLPIAGKDIPLTVSVDRNETSIGNKTVFHEVWTRNFAGRRFTSHMESTGKGVATERFGSFIFTFALSVKENELLFPVNTWRVGFIPMPRFLAPLSVTREYQDKEGRFCFDVRITLPFFGLLVHYRGWLKPRAYQIVAKRSESR
jgi:saccharopine dehydrogenase-like NADP-dependent oxidoreductase